MKDSSRGPTRSIEERQIRGELYGLRLALQRKERSAVRHLRDAQEALANVHEMLRRRDQLTRDLEQLKGSSDEVAKKPDHDDFGGGDDCPSCR